MAILPQLSFNFTSSPLCLCGCGLPVTLALRTDKRKGWIKGEPVRYLANHYTRPKMAKVPPASVKRCTLCGVPKTPDAFNKCSRHLDGLGSWCRDCNKSNSASWAARNAGQKNALNARWYEANTARVKQNVVRWRRDNHARHLWHNRTRRARQNGAAGTASPEQVAARVAYFGGRCSYCGGAYEHLDHVIPLSRGGSNWPANLRPSCIKCNTQKGAKTYFEWHGGAADPGL